MPAVVSLSGSNFPPFHLIFQQNQVLGTEGMAQQQHYLETFPQIYFHQSQYFMWEWCGISDGHYLISISQQICQAPLQICQGGISITCTLYINTRHSLGSASEEKIRDHLGVFPNREEGGLLNPKTCVI